jgi:integrase
VVNKAGKNSAAYSADYDPDVVFTTRLSATVTVHNLNRAFNALLDELDLKTGADGRTRTLYSWRHFYATQDLERGVSTHALSRQLGSSTEMIDRHYSNTVRCRTLSCIVGGNANFDETPVV